MSDNDDDTTTAPVDADPPTAPAHNHCDHCGKVDGLEQTVNGLVDRLATMAPGNPEEVTPGRKPWTHKRWNA
jgi:hypothetical protein